MNLFNLGQIGMDARARAEILFHGLCEKVLRYLRRQEDYLEDYEEELTALKKLLAHKYVANYSMFQSTPDVWGVKQLFPITPIHRLDEDPTETASLCDLTCDSDGEVKRFIDQRQTKEVLELHASNGEPYYLGFMMLGAYQDVLGNFHNMFGPVNEAFVELGRDGSWKVTQVVAGGTAADMLEHMNYDVKGLKGRMEEVVAQATNNGSSREQAKAFLAEYGKAMAGYTYLDAAGEPPASEPMPTETPPVVTPRRRRRG
jgi:arginine decarboxylase